MVRNWSIGFYLISSVSQIPICRVVWFISLPPSVILTKGGSLYLKSVQRVKGRGPESFLIPGPVFRSGGGCWPPRSWRRRTGAGIPKQGPAHPDGTGGYPAAVRRWSGPPGSGRRRCPPFPRRCSRRRTSPPCRRPR